MEQIERAVCAALATYSNVHRGSGHHALVSTRLYEQARDIVLEHLGLSRKKYVVIFCTPRRATMLQARLPASSHRCVSSQDIGLPLAMRAVAVLRKALPKGIPRETGGGTARLVAPGWVIWSSGADRFEAGTPAITNVIALARALQLQHGGQRAFQAATPTQSTADEHDDLDGSSGRELLSKLRQTLIGQGARVPIVDGERPYVNLDNGASTPTFQPIWEAVRRSWHMPSQARQAIIEQARSICADVLGAPLALYNVIFTSNTTEAINLAAESLGKEGQNTRWCGEGFGRARRYWRALRLPLRPPDHQTPSRRPTMGRTDSTAASLPAARVQFARRCQGKLRHPEHRSGGRRAHRCARHNSPEAAHPRTRSANG